MIILQDRNLNGSSTNWLNWMSTLTITTCSFCMRKHGTVYSPDEYNDIIMTITKRFMKLPDKENYYDSKSALYNRFFKS